MQKTPTNTGIILIIGLYPASLWEGAPNHLKSAAKESCNTFKNKFIQNLKVEVYARVVWKNKNKLLLLILSSDSTQSFFRQSNRYCGHIPTKIIIANILVMVNIPQNKGRLSLIPYTLLSARISLQKAKPLATAHNPLTLAWVPPCHQVTHPPSVT